MARGTDSWLCADATVVVRAEMSVARWRRRICGLLSLRLSLRYTIPLLVADPKEGKDIPVGIGDLEAPQAVIDERQLFHERRTSLLELVEQRVGVQGVDVSIPASPSVPGVVWTGKHLGKDSLEHDADPVPAYVAIVHVFGWALEVQLETEALDVVGDRGLQVLHDEERTN